MTTRRRRVLIALAVAAAAIVVTVIGAGTLLPHLLRGLVERAASRALGRELTIAGPFDVSLVPTPRLEAGGVSLANAPWGSEPAMARVGRVTIVPELWSLWSGPVRVRELEVDDALLVLEANGDGRGNWVLEPRPVSRPPPEAKRRPPVLFDQVAIRGLEVVYRPRPDAAPVTLGVRSLDARRVPTSRVVDLRGDGHFNRVPWEVAGRLGPLEDLPGGHDVAGALVARMGDSRVEIRGRVGDPRTLGAPDFEVSANGPDIAAALGNFGLRSPLTGPFRVRGRFTPAPDSVDVDLDASVGGVTAVAHGAVRGFPTLDRFDLTVEAAGPEASAVGSWLGVRGLPPRSFDLAGRVRREEGRFPIDGARVRVGSTSLAVSGALGMPPRFVGTDLAVRASGQDLSELSALTRLRLPPGPFDVAGRFLRRADGLAIEAVELRLHDALICAGGTIGEPPRLPNLDLTVDASGSELTWFSPLVGVDVPPRPFVLRGRVVRNGPALTLDGVEGRFGDDTVSVAGRLMPAKHLEGSDVHLRVAGPDLAELAALAELAGVPAQPFEAQGRVLVVEGGWELDGVDASVGRVTAAVEGRIGAPSVLDGTSLSGRVHGPALSDLAAWGLPGSLPADPFSVAGRLRMGNDVVTADQVVATVGGDRVGVDGVLGALPDLSLLDVGFDAAGPSLAGLGRFFAAAGLNAPGRLPAEAYAISGRVRRVPAGYELHEVHAEAGNTTVRFGGTAGTGSDLNGTDVRFDAAAPDTCLVSDLAGIALPEGRFEAHGRLARVETGWRVDRVTVAIGDARAEASGTLGAWPGLEGTDLMVVASGPDLGATLGPLVGSSALPVDPFEISSTLSGGAARLASARFAARLGGSDLEGRVGLRLEGKPTVDADLRSNRLDLSGLFAGSGAEPAAGPAPAAQSGQAGGASVRLVPDDPLRLGALSSLDATLRLEAAEVVIPGFTIRDVVVAGELRGGALRLDRVEGAGLRGGRATASLSLAPSGDGYRVRSEGRIDGGRLVLQGADAPPEDAPTVDLELDLEGEGRSLHEIVASSEGWALVILGSGRIPSALGDRLNSPVIRGLLEAFNPFRATSDHTELECAIASARVEGGKVVVEPIAVRTDTITVIGHGAVDLQTETIDLTWTIKPRKGVGISASSIANPYIMLSGTLSSPELEMKPLQAAASMSAALATGGMTILRRGFYDRITAEKKVCVDALAEVAEQVEAREPPAGH